MTHADRLIAAHLHARRAELGDLRGPALRLSSYRNTSTGEHEVLARCTGCGAVRSFTEHYTWFDVFGFIGAAERLDHLFRVRPCNCQAPQ